MNDSIKVFFDGSKYMVLDSSGKTWAEGTTLDEAYEIFRSKISDKELLSKGHRQLYDISLMWLAYRKSIMIVLVIFGLVYAQVAVILSLPNYVYDSLGVTQVDRVVSITDKVTNKLNAMPVADKDKINLSLGRLRDSLCQISSVINCTDATNLKK